MLSQIDLTKARMFGRGYVMMFCIASFKQKQEQKSLEMYITEGIRFISENTAKRVENGKYLALSYNDLINPKEEDNRTAEEIVDDVIAKCGLKEVS